MAFAGKTVVVTGGASGIGAALVARFAALGARTCVLDLASNTGAEMSLTCDVSDPYDLACAIETVEAEVGPIEIYVSNAGVLSGHEPSDALGHPNDWTRCWDVNVMAHVHAARRLIPDMTGRGGGHFVIVASAAGLLNQIGDAAYSATKHAAVSFAETLAITHRDDGVGVTLVCPQYVATPLIGLGGGDAQEASGILTADAVAVCILNAIKEGRFLTLPHAEVQGYVELRARDHDRWIKGMAGLRRRSIDTFGDARPEHFYKLV
jgi:NAD(P)-dependent dehydrogenase (short-subunit alcohol dehydrogenase family)